MIPGFGKGVNPKKMASMMKQMGISLEEVENVESVTIRTSDKDIIIDNPQVTIMKAKGTKTYQIVGTSREVEREIEILDEDVKLVIEQTNIDEKTALETLKKNKGDIATTIMELTNNV